MNRSNLSNILALCALAACQNSTNASVDEVSEAQYRSDRCWRTGEGEMSALLVLARSEKEGIPYLISDKCILKDSPPSTGESVLTSLSQIRVIDDSRFLEKRITGLKIEDNVRTDLPMPSANDQVYVIKFDYIRSSSTPNVVSIKKVKDFRSTPIKFIDLLESKNSGALAAKMRSVAG